MNKLIEISDSLYNEAIESIKLHNITHAIDYIEKAIYIYARDSQYFNLLGLCYYMQCKFGQAKLYWEKSIQIQDINNRAQYYLGMMEDKSFKEIINKYNNALEYITLKKYDKSIKLFLEIVAYNSEWAEPFSILGLCYFQTGQVSFAEQYIREAIQRDYGNKEYKEYLLVVHNQTDIKVIDNKIIKWNLMVGCLVSIVVIVGGWKYYQKHLEYREVSKESIQYIQQLEQLASTLELKEKQYQEQKQQNDSLKISKKEIQQENEELINSNKEVISIEVGEKNLLSIGKSEKILFRDSLNLYRQGEYQKAKEGFKVLIMFGVDQGLVSESVYFLAESNKKLGEYNEAYHYYTEYAKKYKMYNYYDDALYECGIMLYQIGDIEKAKEVLISLKEDMPDSIFNNSKVKYILNK